VINLPAETTSVTRELRRAAENLRAMCDGVTRFAKGVQNVAAEMCTCMTKPSRVLWSRPVRGDGRVEARHLRSGEHFTSAGGSVYERVPDLDEHFDGERRLLGCRRFDGLEDTVSPEGLVTPMEWQWTPFPTDAVEGEPVSSGAPCVEVV
jgi:hypothetical protein